MCTGPAFQYILKDFVSLLETPSGVMRRLGFTTWKFEIDSLQVALVVDPRLKGGQALAENGV
jgi:hypothetical protein